MGPFYATVMSSLFTTPTDTYSSYLLARITFTWGMRSTQQPSDNPGASVWRLRARGKKQQKKSNIKTWLWVSAPRKATVSFGPVATNMNHAALPIFYSIPLEPAGVEHRSGVVLSCKGTTTSRLFWPSTPDLPRTEHSDWGVVISLRTRWHSVHRATPHPSCRRLLTATSFKKQKPFFVFQPFLSHGTFF